MLSASQRQIFAEWGVLTLRRVLPIESVAAMRDAVWRFLERRDGMLREDRDTWRDKRPRKFQSLTRGKSFTPFPDAGLRAVADALLDGPFETALAQSPRQLLFTLPNATSWQVPHAAWHLDIPRTPDHPGVPGLQFFAFLDEVRSRGGGTLALAGSHRLLANTSERLTSSAVKKRLRRHSPYLHDLWSKRADDRRRFLDVPGDVDGVPVRVVELTGDPGDVAVVDMRVFHAPAPNALDRPRIMLTTRLTLDELAVEMFGAPPPQATAF